jgi:hypothetical protein
VESVYVETSVISYLAADASRDMIVAAHQAIGWEWWQTAATKHVLYVSQAVLTEIQVGDDQQIERRLELIKGLPVLTYPSDVIQLVDYYDEKLGLTGAARVDVPHFAFAVAYELNFLVTWNCKHIANAAVLRRLKSLNDAVRKKTPIVGTPDILLGAEEGHVP